MAVDPRMYQNVATSIGAASPYYDISVNTNTTMTSSRLFVHGGAGSLNNPYYPEDVDEDFIRKLQVYTDAMLVGDIKTVSSEYLWAVQAAVGVLRRTRRLMTSEQIEAYWAEATEMKGNLPEDFAKIIQERLTR